MFEEGWDWQTELSERLPALGHRNWILIADSAYPEQIAAGLELLVTEDDQLEVIGFVAQALSQVGHVKARVHVDAELRYVPEAHAPGIEAFRLGLAKLARHTEAVPHEELIARVAEAAQSFTVLVLKTNSVLPYTTVFLELDCGYWDAEREAALREAMAAG